MELDPVKKPDRYHVVGIKKLQSAMKVAHIFE